MGAVRSPPSSGRPRPARRRPSDRIETQHRVVGGGVEHALSDNLSARVEYRYSDLGEGDGGFDRHQALFGLSYRF